MTFINDLIDKNYQKLATIVIFKKLKRCLVNSQLSSSLKNNLIHKMCPNYNFTDIKSGHKKGPTDECVYRAFLLTRLTDQAAIGK